MKSINLTEFGNRFIHSDNLIIKSIAEQINRAETGDELMKIKRTWGILIKKTLEK
jgi:hypothetical protein